MIDLEKKKILIFGYEDTDKKIEIELYGIVFEINNFESIEKLENINKNDMNSIEIQIEEILGSGAIEKINKKRNQDGYKDMDIKVALNVLGCIFEVYGKSIIGEVTSKVSNTVDEIENNVNNFTNKFENREQRRKQRNNYNRGYRKGYRRY